VARRHLFICTNTRASGKPACGVRRSDAIVVAVQTELVARGATDILVTPCGCLGPCFDGPTAVVYPDGVWYGGLEVSDATSLVDHLIDGTTFAAKVSEPPGIGNDSAAGDDER
jgi:(2Fe-2S) ferredoxin